MTSAVQSGGRRFFEAHARATLAVVISVGVLVVLALAEISLRVFVGLGDPLLYRSSPLYGYRPQPNQFVRRVNGAEIRINNLGLRANEDWDDDPEKKILFLGNSVTFGGTYLSNQDLFSSVAVEGLHGYISGNAGVNGWGVENIHALVVEGGFMPASVYVTVVEDIDFERGLSKFAGQPFWSSKPDLALVELLSFFYYNQVVKMHEGHDGFATPFEKEKTKERAVRLLKELDETIRARGYKHLIFFSTDVDQLIDGRPLDPVVQKYLRMSNLPVVYMKDRPEVTSLSGEEIEKVFYDWNHLDKSGHRLWGKIIRDELRALLAENGGAH